MNPAAVPPCGHAEAGGEPSGASPVVRLFDRNAGISLALPDDRGAVSLRRFPTDAEWDEHVSRLRYRFDENEELADCLRNAERHRVLLDSLANEKLPALTDDEGLRVVQWMTGCECQAWRTDAGWLIGAAILGGECKTAAVFRDPKPAAVAGYWREVVVIEEVGSERVVTARLDRQCALFDDLVISTHGYAAADVPAFHKAAFARALVDAAKRQEPGGQSKSAGQSDDS